MYTCPWCGTTHPSFQSNCSNCGGPLLASPDQTVSSFSNEEMPEPPPPPRPVSTGYAWRLLFSDGWAIAALVFSILGLIFTVVGAALTVAIITAFVGIPFLLIGLPFLAAGIGLEVWRYRIARRTVDVLRTGQSVRGQVEDVSENYSVTVNGRHPWTIRYAFQADGTLREGRVTTLTPPGPRLQPGRTVWVLFLANDPSVSSVYPHP